MEIERIKKLREERKILPKSYEAGQILSLLEKIQRNIKITLAIPFTEESADVVFIVIYESVRELGDALWWSEGYEPQYHETSLDILKRAECFSPEQKVRLQSLSRFKEIRHDSNYRGFKVSYYQALELKELWDSIGSTGIQYIKKVLTQKKDKLSEYPARES